MAGNEEVLEAKHAIAKHSELPADGESALDSENRFCWQSIRRNKRFSSLLRRSCSTTSKRLMEQV